MKEYFKSKNYLEYQYLNRKLSTNQIARLCNTSNTTIITYLKKFKIPIRSDSEGIRIYFQRKQNLKYQNKKFLEKKYLEEKKSSHEISRILNCSNQTVLNWLRKFNIPIRKNGYAIKLALQKREV